MKKKQKNINVKRHPSSLISLSLLKTILADSYKKIVRGQLFILEY